MMHIRIECVVDRHAYAGAGPAIRGNNSLATPIGEHEIIARDCLSQMMLAAAIDGIERRRGVRVPLGADCVWRTRVG